MTLTVAQVSDHCGPKLLPHLGSLVQLVASCAAAAEARVRWAGMVAEAARWPSSYTEKPAQVCRRIESFRRLK